MNAWKVIVKAGNLPHSRVLNSDSGIGFAVVFTRAATWSEALDTADVVTAGHGLRRLSCESVSPVDLAEVEAGSAVGVDVGSSFDHSPDAFLYAVYEYDSD